MVRDSFYAGAPYLWHLLMLFLCVIFIGLAIAAKIDPDRRSWEPMACLVAAIAFAFIALCIMTPYLF